MSIRWLARIVVIGAMFALRAPGTSADQGADVVVVSGELHGRFLAGELFHIDEFWIRVPNGTEFNRWLSRGLGHKVAVLITANPAKFGDVETMRILSGTLIHNIAPAPTPVVEDVVGRLPEGNLGFVHILFLKDELSGTFGPITFETTDHQEAMKFADYDGKPITIVIRIE
jgi:hypothetical protein